MKYMTITTIHAGIPASEILPTALSHVSGVTTSSAIASVKRIQLFPQGGRTANPSDTLQFSVQDPGFLDLRSAVLHANILVSAGGAQGANATVDDGATSVIRQCVIQVDGQNLETCDHVNKLALMETYMTCSKSTYDRSLSFAGFWKFNSELKAFIPGAAALSQWCDVSSNLVAAAELYQTPTTGWDVAIPMGLVSPFFRQEKYFPSRFANNLNIQLQLESATQALFGTGTITTPTYQLQNVMIEVNSVTLNPNYVAWLQDQVMKEDGAGLTMAFNTRTSSQGQAQLNGSENNFVVSRASRNLKRVALVNQNTAAIALGTINYPKISTFPSAGFNTRGTNNTVAGQVQIVVAGQAYPQFPQKGSMAYWTTQAAYNGAALSDCGGGIVNYRTYGATTEVNGNATLHCSPWCDSFIWAYDLSKLTGTSDKLDDDGIDSTGNAQVSIILKTGNNQNSAAAQSFTPLVELVSTKFLTLSKGELKIIG